MIYMKVYDSDLYEIVYSSIVLISLCLLTGA